MDDWKKEIDAMTRMELARKWRFAPTGDTFWQGERGAYAIKRFKALGFFSPEISKALGW